MFQLSCVVVAAAAAVCYGSCLARLIFSLKMLIPIS